jgi:hypothetical protein
MKPIISIKQSIGKVSRSQSPPRRFLDECQFLFCDYCLFFDKFRCIFIYIFLTNSDAFLFTFFVANAFISRFSTQTMHTSHFIHNSTAMFPWKPYTLAGFEPGSSRSCGGCDVHCAPLPGLLIAFFHVGTRTWALADISIFALLTETFVNISIYA